MMEFICYRGKDKIFEEYSYRGRCGGLLVCAGDLAGLSKMISEYHLSPEGFNLCGKGRIIEDFELNHSKALPKRVLEELALIIKNKTKREVKVVA